MSKPRRTKNFVEAETARRRAIVEHYDHDQARVAMEAMRFYARAIMSFDQTTNGTNADARADGVIAEHIAEDFRVANVGRQFMTGDE